MEPKSFHAEHQETSRASLAPRILSGRRVTFPCPRKPQPEARDNSCLTGRRMTMPVTRNALLESLRMSNRLFFHWILPAILGLLVGVLALAWAVPNESNLPVPLVSLFSPGLKIAELVMPAVHESLAWTFGWFLRIAIGVNAVFYFAIFALLAFLIDRRRSQKS